MGDLSCPTKGFGCVFGFVFGFGFVFVFVFVLVEKLTDRGHGWLFEFRCIRQSILTLDQKDLPK
jgi:hypothetical protein